MWQEKAFPLLISVPLDSPHIFISFYVELFLPGVCVECVKEKVSVLFFFLLLRWFLLVGFACGIMLYSCGLVECFCSRAAVIN